MNSTPHDGLPRRILGRTGLEITTVGLGTWAMSGVHGFGWGPQDDD
jgi:aryl-alcohol dehydrogenase-like predicted oxidoreductase